ncbi:MAG: hypothetical protein JW932_10935 [Deltaproteobacteria bacterium]|nr:hypothetical protein [Deltaproteobacteria bacterium]
MKGFRGIGGRHGVFTFFLREGLNEDADYNKDDSVSLGELTTYLSGNVQRETKNAQRRFQEGMILP